VGTTPAVVQAAGGVVWRPREGGVAVAVVHRPRYDDWSLPKGKRRPGEHLLGTARREVAEETGQGTRLGRSLGSSRYPVLVKGVRTPKQVLWWSMRSTGEQPMSGSEVDEVRWLAPQDAIGLLTHRHEVEVMRRFLDGPLEPSMVLLVRHASAGSRKRWSGDDDLRPLDAAGRAQAVALGEVLAAFDPARIVAAPPLRCLQTVLPLAERLQLPVRVEPLLAERAHARNPVASPGAVRRQADSPASVACSQGGLIPDALSALGHGCAGSRRPSARKASVWILAFDGDRALPAAYVSSPLDGTPSRTAQRHVTPLADLRG
jgi:8-oxo-dGTP pyrophosphatase MutT (NUDIX family)